MDSAEIISLLGQLDDEVDDLEESLAPLIETALSETSSKLPLLDKAKLYVLVTYAIESLLFSYVRLNGTDARKHPVFLELTRVKQYFEKIKIAEAPAAARPTIVDKAAVGRFIKHGLAGNEKFDLERGEREAKERARAHIKFNGLPKRPEKPKSEKSEEAPADEDSKSSGSDSCPDPTGGTQEEPIVEAPLQRAKKVIKPQTPGTRVSKRTAASALVTTSGASTPGGKPKGIEKATQKPASKKKKGRGSKANKNKKAKTAVGKSG